MARVFLSYDRDDAAKARAVAEELENAGHAVWWDFRIKGGSEFSKEIEQALHAADAVVVLWSKHAIESGWVRDEAAVGRDNGRLVPVRLDEARPPLGFRQYQCIELRAWKGRGRPPLHDVLTAIEGVTGGQPSRPDVTGSHSAQGPHAQASRQIPRAPIIIVLAIVAIAAVAVLVWQPWRASREAPLVAVVPASSDRSADSLAADLLIKLGVLQSAHADALQLVDVDSRHTPDFTIKVGSADGGKGSQANLMLVDNRAGTLLWSREFIDPSGNQADLRQQMAYSAAQVLDCAVQALSTTGEPIKLPTLKLYLSGCADLSNLLAQDPRGAVGIFVKVTEQAPKFHGGWKKLLLADIQALRVDRTDRALLGNIQNHITQARRLDPAMAEAFLGETWLRPPRPVAGWMKLVDLAVANDPDNSEVLAFRSIALTNVGLMQQSLADTRRAVKSNPLSPVARDALIVALLNNGQVVAAKNELEKAEQLWPGTTKVLQSRFAVEFRAGDAALALRMMQSGELGPMYTTRTAHERAAHESYLQARIAPSPAAGELAIVNARTLYRQDPTASWVYMRALSEFGRHVDLINFLLTGDARWPFGASWVLFRPDYAALHRDRRFMVIAKRLGLLDFWWSTGRWPDFCSRPDLPYDCKAEAAKLAD